MNIINNITNELINNLNSKLEEYFIKGLENKGFKFTTKFELEEFVKKHCKLEDNIELKERVYYVNDTPFFLHKYNVDMNFTQITEDRKITLSANYGSFAYL